MVGKSPSLFLFFWFTINQTSITQQECLCIVTPRHLGDPPTCWKWVARTPEGEIPGSHSLLIPTCHHKEQGSKVSWSVQTLALRGDRDVVDGSPPDRRDQQSMEQEFGGGVTWKCVVWRLRPVKRNQTLLYSTIFWKAKGFWWLDGCFALLL